MKLRLTRFKDYQPRATLTLGVKFRLNGLCCEDCSVAIPPCEKIHRPALEFGRFHRVSLVLPRCYLILDGRLPIECAANGRAP
jgi:hypothetical protein